MQPRDFLNFLLNKDGNSYYLNNGVVDTTTTPMPTDHLADGWQDTSIKWERNTSYNSISGAFTTPYKFIKSTAKIIRTRFFQYGWEDKMFLLIFWLDKSFGGGWVHRKLFKGRLDLSEYDDETNFVSVPLVDSDLYKLFKANETTVYEIPVGTNTIVKDDGIPLYETTTFSFLDGLPLVYNRDFSLYFVPLAIVSTEGTSSGFTFSNQQPTGPITTNNFGEADAGNLNPINLKLKGNGSFNVDGGYADNGLFKLSYWVGTAAGLTTEYVIFNQHIGPSSTNAFSIDLTIPIPPGSFIVFEVSAFFDQPNFFTLTFNPGTFTASFSNRYKITYTPVMRPVELGQALVSKFAGAGYTFSSTWLGGEWDNLTVTSGDAIRGIKDPVVKTSIADMFTSYNVPCNLRMSISGKTISFERKRTAFSNTTAMYLGMVRDFKKIADKDFQFNSFAFGYPDLDSSTYESLNAKEEFNVTSNFTTNLIVGKLLEIKSVYHGSMYEQELARINLDGKDTTAASVDDTIYFKHIEKLPNGVPGPTLASWYFINYTGGVKYFVNTSTGFYETIGIAAPPPFPADIAYANLNFIANGFTGLIAYLTGNPHYPGWDGNINSSPNTSTISAAPSTVVYNYLRPAYDSITGLLDPESAYNTLISPMNCLRNHGDELRSYLPFQEGNKLVYETSSQTPKLKTVKGGVTIDETADVVIGTLDAPLFVPVDFEFSAPMKREIIDAMKINPDGTFSFSDEEDEMYYGFAKSISIQPANRPAQDTVLICSPQTDLSKLIH